MALDVLALRLGKRYTEETADEFGAVKGAPCTIKSKTAIEGGTRLVLGWENNSGEEQETTVDLMNGAKGDEGLGIKSSVINASNHLILTYDDDTTEDAGEIKNINTDFAHISDINLDNVEDGQILKYNGTSGKWENDSAGSVDTNLVDLRDVDITSATDGQVLTWDATNSKWVNGDGVAVSVSDLEDVDLTSLADGDILVYDATGQKWVRSNALSNKVDKVQGKGLSTNDYDDTDKTKLAGIEDGAEVNVQSDWSQTTDTADDYIKNKPTLGTVASKDTTTYVNPGNHSIPDADTIYTAMTAMLEGAFHPAGSKTCAQLTSDLLVQANVGNVYKITDSGVTDANWVGGAGQTITANQMAVVVYGNEPNTFLFNLENGVDIDLSAYQTKAITPITVDGVQKSNVEDAVDAINTLAGGNKTAIGNIKDGTTIDSFGDVETALADKADKVASATTGNFAGLDATGNLTDSGKKASDFVEYKTTSATDANDLWEENGIFIVNTNAMSNLPTSEASMGYCIEVRRYGDSSNSLVVQLAYRGNPSTESPMYARRKFNNTWTSWVAVATKNDLSSDIQDVYEVMGKNGAKNLLPYPYYSTTKTQNGVTFTDNGDGTVTVDGTATDGVVFFCSIRGENGKCILPNGTYIVTGCPNGGAVSSYKIGASRITGGSGTTYGTDVGNGLTITLDGDDFGDDDVRLQIGIAVSSGTVCDNLLFKPMVRLASDTDSTYQPYVQTNKELTEQKVSYKHLGEVGAKNLLVYPYNDTTKTVNGITFTDNGDGTVTADGTATDTAQFTFFPRNVSGNFTLANGKYIFNGCPADGSTATYRMNWSNSVDANVGNDTGEGTTITVTNPAAYYGFFITIASGTTVSNLVFKPMLRRAEDTDSTYQPYAMTNKELTDEVSFRGTMAEWNALSTVQKTAYKAADIADDEESDTVVEPTLTAGSGVTTLRYYAVKKNGMVFINGCWFGTVVGTGGVIATVSENGRPSKTVEGSGYMGVSDNSVTPAGYRVGTNGTIWQTQTGSTATRGSFSFAYPV